MGETDIRLIMEMLSEVKERLARLETTLSSKPVCGSDCANPKIRSLENRIIDLEKEKTWLYRLFIGGIAAAVLTLVLK